MKNTKAIRNNSVMIEKGILPMKHSIAPKIIVKIKINEAIKYTTEGNLEYIFLWECRYISPKISVGKLNITDISKISVYQGNPVYWFILSLLI